MRKNLDRAFKNCVERPCNGLKSKSSWLGLDGGVGAIRPNLSINRRNDRREMGQIAEDNGCSGGSNSPETARDAAKKRQVKRTNRKSACNGPGPNVAQKGPELQYSSNDFWRRTLSRKKAAKKGNEKWAVGLSPQGAPPRPHPSQVGSTAPKKWVETCSLTKSRGGKKGRWCEAPVNNQKDVEGEIHRKCLRRRGAKRPGRNQTTETSSFPHFRWRECRGHRRSY